MRLNCLFRESFKSRVPNSRVFFSVKASIYFAGDQLCAVRQCWGVCNSKVSWSPKRKLTVMINASFSEYIKPINHPFHHYTKWATVVVSAYLAHWYCKRAVTMKSVQKINYKEQTIRETYQGSKNCNWLELKTGYTMYFHLASKAGVFFWARAKDACFHCVVVD